VVTARGLIRGRPWAAACSLLLVLVMPVAAQANGGLLQMADAVAGPYRLTVFTNPSPIEVGSADVSVSVTGGKLDASGTYPIVANALITVHWTPLNHSGTAGSDTATHDKATNKIFYATTIKPDTKGAWQVTLVVQSAAGRGAASFDTDVAAAPGSVLLLNIILVGLLFILPLLAFVVYTMTRRRGGPADEDDDEDDELAPADLTGPAAP